MTEQLPASNSDGFVPRLALLYAGFFVFMGVQMPFFPIWLKSQGLDAQAIGLVLATPMVVRVVAVPLASRVADRRAELAGLLATASIASVAGYAVVGLCSSEIMILVTIAVASIALTPIGPLTDAYALQGLGWRRRSYGTVRLWGSAAFVGANLGAGSLLDVISPRHLIWTMVASLGVMAGAALQLVPAGGDRGTHEARYLPRPGFGGLFWAIALAASLIQASHAVYYGFSTLNWTARGLDGTVIGALWALGVLAEIVLFAVSGRFTGRIGATTLVGLGATGAVLRWTAMGLEPPIWMLPGLQLLHGLSFGATHLGTMQYVAEFAPNDRRATAMGDLSTLMGIVMAAAMSLAGVLYGSYGSAAYWAMAFGALIGGLIALVAPSKARD